MKLHSTYKIGQLNLEPAARQRFIICSDIKKARSFYESLVARDFDEMLEHHLRSISTAILDSPQSHQLDYIGNDNDSVYVAVDGNADDAIEAGNLLIKNLQDNPHSTNYIISIGISYGYLLQIGNEFRIPESGPQLIISNILAKAAKPGAIALDEKTYALSCYNGLDSSTVSDPLRIENEILVYRLP
jgi:hypothetical protein